MIERVERALLVLAYLVEIDGDVHLPMYEVFESKLDELRSKADVRQRARNRLHSFMGHNDNTAITDRAPRPLAALGRSA
jgi:CRISPR/Cas system CSM-associated protein Csm2 small subunit